MKTLLIAMGLCGALICGGGCDADDGAGPAEDLGTTEPDGGTPRRVLFIGNSYTYVNDLPRIIEALGAATPGAAITTEIIAEGGASLGSHWTNPSTRARLTSGGLDLVVLQGQSLEPLIAPEGFDAYARLFADALADAGLRGVWFATWARRDDSADYMNFPQLGGPPWMTYAIEARYRAAAALHGDALARVGAAFRMARSELPAIELYDADGSHPSAAGTLLAACVILRTIAPSVQPRVPSPAPLGLEASVAKPLCALAARVVPSPQACPPRQTLCGEVCVDLQADPLNCGKCGNPCPGEDPCLSGVCGCPSPYAGCARSCVDLAMNPRHCGICEHMCATGELCDTGACRCALAEVVAMSVAELSARNAACAPMLGPDDPVRASAACREAAHAICAARGTCFDSGLPPPVGHSPLYNDGLCVRAVLHTTDFATLRTFEAGCDGAAARDGKACVTAISRYCAAQGAVSGFGPVGGRSDEVVVSCLPAARKVRARFDDVRAYASRCLPDPVTCQAAARAYCEAQGHAGGFGPVEEAGAEVEVICLPP